MHELSVTQNILSIALEHGERAGARRITVLYLVIGQLSTIVDDSVQFYWEIIAEGTLAAGSKLHFRRIPAELECRECGTRFGLGRDSFDCPTCGSERVQVIAGEEFYVEAIEVEGDIDDTNNTPAAEQENQENENE
ncbi:MAG: hydrogenase maturation nickel metallochaperone HypA [Anaerolineae bacterium]|nr:hydrogenase maturation nickel metallochaperone HypA [Anaerolineae bacterium]